MQAAELLDGRATHLRVARGFIDCGGKLVEFIFRRKA
jgi:hypothetical protein